MPILTCISQPLQRIRKLLSVLAFACAVGPAIAGEYTLAPGDTVRLQVAGIEQFSTVAQVSNNGFVSLPHFGRIEAKGRTIDQVRTTLQEMIGSVTFRVFDASNLSSVLEVTSDDIVLEVERYRDVPVLGFVDTPGLIPFSPGMTVRAVIAAAGGILRQDAAGAGLDLPATAIRLAEISRLKRARAETLARIWRLESSLGEERPPPSAAELGLSKEDADELLALEADILAIANENHRDSTDLLDSLHLLFADRAKSLQQQQKHQSDALEIDRQELARIRKLMDQGLVVADRVHQMSRMQYLSEAEFLQTQGEIERLQIQRAQSDDQRRKLDADLRESNLTALAEARRALFETESQIAGGESALALAVPGAFPQAAPLPVETEVVIHRGTGAGAIEIRPRLDALVQPGDVVEVLIKEATASGTEVGQGPRRE